MKSVSSWATRAGLDRTPTGRRRRRRRRKGRRKREKRPGEEKKTARLFGRGRFWERVTAPVSADRLTCDGQHEGLVCGVDAELFVLRKRLVARLPGLLGERGDGRGSLFCLLDGEPLHVFFLFFFFLGSREQASLDRSRRTEDAPLASRPRYARCRVRQLRSDVAEGGAVATQRRQGVPGDGASRHRERHEYNVVVLFALRRRGCQPSYLSTQEGAGGIQPDIKCSPPPKGGCSISVQVHFLYRCT